ncbi:N-acetyltransferase family protein [Actinophytocola sp.]|uniref:GNAT family N-acetyltransferase n=1 Tax=Actinophytocola sp. TaxID=1872138 RepID=UPI00389B0C3C
MNIRLAERADGAAVAEVHIEGRNAYYNGHVDVETLDRRAAQLRGIYGDMPTRFDRNLWCAEVDGEIVGMALVGPPQEWLGPWVGELYQIHVRPDHWRRGIGSALHEACMGAWRAGGITVGVVEVWSRNDRAQAFYESHGWRADGHTRPGPAGTEYVRLRRTIL